MGNVAGAGAVGGVEGSLEGFLSGGALTGNWVGAIAGAIAGGIIGTTTSALSAYIAQQNKATLRTSSDTIQTNSVRILPVPVLFGRNRIGGNYLGVGTFWGKDSYRPHKRGDPCRIANGLLGLCEGEITQIGNFRCDGRLLKALR